CGSGQAMTMTANRFSHIRAALCCNGTMARLARQHNDANVLTIGAHTTGREVALDIVDAFLSAEFLGGRYTPRRDMMSQFGEK
ncbi:MAG: RpiB/LacA/LacB family sugar-phosphate isomerase, partial [Alphaproteobacteria bacterium]|nr:RpiB/LacA/LacB family sugar-phosphate isomerase [Alphaproteobacteria bacterium]